MQYCDNIQHKYIMYYNITIIKLTIVVAACRPVKLLSSDTRIGSYNQCNYNVCIKLLTVATMHKA